MASKHGVQLRPGQGYPEGLDAPTRELLASFFRDMVDDSDETASDRVEALFQDEGRHQQALLLVQAGAALALATYTHSGTVAGPMSKLVLSEIATRAQRQLPDVNVDELADELIRASRDPGTPRTLRLHGSARQTLGALAMLTQQAALAAAAVHPHAPTVKPTATRVPPMITRLAAGLLTELDEALAASPTPMPVLTTGADDAPDPEHSEAARAASEFARGAVIATGAMLLPLDQNLQLGLDVTWPAAGLPGFVFRAEDEPDVAELVELLRHGEAPDADTVAKLQIACGVPKPRHRG